MLLPISDHFFDVVRRFPHGSYFYVFAPVDRNLQFQQRRHASLVAQVQKILLSQTVQDCLVGDGLDQETVKRYAENFSEIWSEIFPIERQRILDLLLERVSVFNDHVDVEIKTGGINAFIKEMTDGND